VDVPTEDAWSNLPPRGFSPAWLFKPHNEHRIVTTKLLIWILYKVDGWNIATHTILNFLIYGILLGCIVWFGRRTNPELPWWATLAFLIFMLSPNDAENHAMAFQSQWHFVFLFFIAGLPLVFDDKQSWGSLSLGVTFLCLSIYSLALGWVLGAVACLTYVVYKMSRCLGLPAPAARRREGLQLLSVACALLLSLALWFHGYHKPSDSPPSTSPLRASYWSFYVNLISWGFAFDDDSAINNAICALLVFLPVAMLAHLLWTSRSGKSNGPIWALLAAALGILGALAAISYGRAGSPDAFYASKESRYAEAAMMLIPLCVLCWSAVLRAQPRLWRMVIPALWLFCCVSYRDSWSDFDSYARTAQYHQAALNYTRQFYRHGGNGYCQWLFPRPIPDLLRRAKELGLSFTR
jgi:hypothetical protein